MSEKYKLHGNTEPLGYANNYSEPKTCSQQYKDSVLKSFLPLYANKYDLSILNKFLSLQSPRKYTNDIDLIFGDKTELAKNSVLQVISQMKERQLIKETNLKKIDYNMCSVNSRIFRLENLFGKYDSGLNKEKDELEKIITGLEKEKRDEDVSCWRDLVQLRKDLMFIMGEYKSSSRKKMLVSMGNIEDKVNDG